MLVMKRLPLMLLGFVVCAGVVLVLEFALLYAIQEGTHSRIMPRGIGWFLVPFAAGIGGAKLFAHLAIFKAETWRNLSTTSAHIDRHFRLMLVGAAAWFIGYIGYWFIAEPFGYSMNSRETWEFVRTLLIPPVGFVALYVAILWAWNGRLGGHRPTDQDQPPRVEPRTEAP